MRELEDDAESLYKGIKAYGSEVARFCASRAAGQNATAIPHESDRLHMLAEPRNIAAPDQAPPSHETLADIREDAANSVNFDPSIPGTHDWYEEWTKMRREQLRAFQSCLLNTEALRYQLRDPKARLEAQMLLQFELLKRRNSYPNYVRDAMAQALKVLESIDDGVKAVPSWFIPRYEIVLDMDMFHKDHFGAAYCGKWFDKDVVVRFIEHPPEPEGDSSEWFWSVANHWFMLNHQNVVQLYGACHVGTPFFVCELTKSTLLPCHLKKLASAKPAYNLDENGGARSDIMRYIFLMGMGLKYLHHRGIIHCDLTGNRFLVGTDGKTVKLGSLGSHSGNGRPAVHLNDAVRWKAPEYLLGEPATVMSDVYSFGMCILEILSGKLPWGNSVDDAAVKYHVTKRKAFPARPKDLSDFQWSLVQHMCCFNPSERISLDAVVDMLHTFRFEN